MMRQDKESSYFIPQSNRRKRGSKRVRDTVTPLLGLSHYYQANNHNMCIKFLVQTDAGLVLVASVSVKQCEF